MPHTMNQTDLCRAAAALMDWFDSQDMSPKQAVSVLTLSLVELMAEIGKAKGWNMTDGGKLLADCIVTALAERSKEA